MDILTLVLAHAVRSAEPEIGFSSFVAMSVAAEAEAAAVEKWRVYIDEAARRFGIPAHWIQAVIEAESGGRTLLNGAPITSPAGAMGLMQLMPATYAELRDRYGLGPDPHDPRDNILAGTAYLREMRERFGRPGLFAAYHAGPTRYEAYLKGEQSLPEETLAYLTTLLPRIDLVVVDDRKVAQRMSARASFASGKSLFFPLGRHETRPEIGSPNDASRSPERHLFARSDSKSHGDSAVIDGDLFVPLSGTSR
ncbi:lytic transglycosylase domain-containing protein [Parvibaculum sp.]|uniref:lytic transglycosylase domain-containing protein n=1 Tax=Parvibaculum sp. TaxID=2024848 RepID=UPI002B5256BA|nr:lytic transglycosylase domain-containing protein [Parvibaculum sp.]HUD53086.1 lytic transglycosylase domain-containing protein [Parvibaculum sp.]